MASQLLIVGMWGTTNLNLFLLENKASQIYIREHRKGPGASKVAKDQFEDVLFELIGDWLDLKISSAIILAGMVGSTIGWFDAGYTNCPIDVQDIEFAPPLHARGKDIYILSGLVCSNIQGNINVMRGEETELFGALSLRPELRAGEHLICMPGTHTKWVTMRDGMVLNFTSSMSGELFACLSEHSVLVGAGTSPSVQIGAGFEAGISAAIGDPGGLLHMLFSVRARQLTGCDDGETALQRLSGLIIGNDVAFAMSAFAHRETPVIVIGSDPVSKLYAYAIEQCGGSAAIIPADLASTQGLWELSRTKRRQGSLQ